MNDLGQWRGTHRIRVPRTGEILRIVDRDPASSSLTVVRDAGGFYPPAALMDGDDVIEED